MVRSLQIKKEGTGTGRYTLIISFINRCSSLYINSPGPLFVLITKENFFLLCRKKEVERKFSVKRPPFSGRSVVSFLQLITYLS